MNLICLLVISVWNCRIGTFIFGPIVRLPLIILNTGNNINRNCWKRAKKNQRAKHTIIDHTLTFTPVRFNIEFCTQIINRVQLNLSLAYYFPHILGLSWVYVCVCIRMCAFSCTKKTTGLVAHKRQWLHNNRCYDCFYHHNIFELLTSSLALKSIFHICCCFFSPEWISPNSSLLSQCNSVNCLLNYRITFARSTYYKRQNTKKAHKQ